MADHWSITVPLDMRAKVVTSGRAPTLDQAKKDFFESWATWGGSGTTPLLPD